MKRCLPVCLLLFSFSAYGALTKWVDADGKVHYSDEPPPADAKTKKVTIPSSGGEVASPTYVEREAELRKANKDKEEATKKAAKQQGETLAKQRWCASLNANLTTLEKSPRIASYNEKGEKVYMDDAARQQEIAETRKQLAECN